MGIMNHDGPRQRVGPGFREESTYSPVALNAILGHHSRPLVTNLGRLIMVRKTKARVSVACKVRDLRIV